MTGSLGRTSRLTITTEEGGLAMGMGGHVRCNCLDEGKAAPPPVPREWLHLDVESGWLYLDSDEEAEGDDDRFQQWLEVACEHPMMVYAADRVSSYGGLTLFDRIVRAAGADRFPTLLDNYGIGEYTCTLPEASAKALAELALLQTMRRSGNLDTLFAKDELSDEGEYDSFPEPLRAFMKAERPRGNLSPEDFDGICGTLEMLFRASVETGNPVFWN
jgi:hypothetical protein